MVSRRKQEGTDVTKRNKCVRMTKSSGDNPTDKKEREPMSTISIHKNLNNGRWAIGSPVQYSVTALAFGVSFPTPDKLQRNKQFRACLAGGSRKVFAKARCQNLYWDDDMWESVYARRIMAFNKILNDYRLGGITPPNLTRIYFNPTEGDEHFTVHGKPDAVLSYADIVYFSDDGNAYIVGGA